MLIYVIGIFVGFVFLVLYDGANRQGKKLPPGPKGLPFFGNVFSMVGQVPYLKYAEWAKRYGNIMTVKMFGTRLIIISDAKLGREAYNKPELLGKAEVHPFLLYLNGPQNYAHKPGIMFSEGKEWSTQRKFTQRQLRDYGLGKQALMEDHIKAEVSHLVSSLQSLKGQPVFPLMKIAEATSNVAWRMIVGERLEHTKEVTQLLDSAMLTHLNLMESPLALFLPSLVKLGSKAWKELVGISAGIQAIITNQVKRHQEHRVSSGADDPRDFMDAYLKRIGDGKDSEFNLMNLQATVSELYISALEPTSVVATWAILLITSSPSVKLRLEQDLQNVLGDGRWPSLEDKKDLPFLEAIISEALRYSSMAPFGLLHRATADTELSGYFIPKGTWIAINQYWVHHDPQIWGDPQEFRPDRFLTKDSEGKTVLRNNVEELIPFSVGKRICFGDQLTRNCHFMILARLFQQFDVSFDPNSPAPSLESQSHALRLPRPFKIVVEKRSSAHKD